MIRFISKHDHFLKVGFFFGLCIGLTWYLTPYFYSHNQKPVLTAQAEIENAIASNNTDLFTIGPSKENNINLDVEICSRKCPAEYTM